MMVPPRVVILHPTRNPVAGKYNRSHVFAAAVPAFMASLGCAADRHLRRGPCDWGDEWPPIVDRVGREAGAVLHDQLRPPTVDRPRVVPGVFANRAGRL